MTSAWALVKPQATVQIPMDDTPAFLILGVQVIDELCRIQYAMWDRKRIVLFVRIIPITETNMVREQKITPIERLTSIL